MFNQLAEVAVPAKHTHTLIVTDVSKKQRLLSDYIRGLDSFGLLLDELSFGVDCKQASVGDSHLLVGVHVLQKEGAEVMTRLGKFWIFLSV